MVKRKIIIASHNKLAYGMNETLKYLVGGLNNIIEISAYLNNIPVNEEISAKLKNISEEDEVIVFTDLLGGSVNQAFIPYLNRNHFHVITGFNLPVVMALFLQPSNDYLNVTTIEMAIQEAREQLVYVNELTTVISDDDE